MLNIDDYNLRPATDEDLGRMLKWRNSERVRAFMYTSHIIPETEHLNWWRRVKDDVSVCYMVLEYAGIPVGMSYFTDIDTANSKCEWGFYLGETDLPRGSGTVMGYLSLNHIFIDRRIRKVYGEVLDFNAPSRKFFERLGFAQDGILRKHVIKDGRTVDVVLFSMLADEWSGHCRDEVLRMVTEKPQTVSMGSRT